MGQKLVRARTTVLKRTRTNKCYHVFRKSRFLTFLQMAEAPCSLELLLQCQICFQEFEEDGAHVPRLLPCSHTLCHSCVGQLIQGQKIECPECRKKHEAREEVKSFPQNKYLLTQIKRKPSSEEPTAHGFQKCEQHGKEISLFCLEPECNKPICRTCLKKEHKKHEITEIEDQEKEVLLRYVVKIRENLEAKMEIFSTAKKDITERRNVVVTQLKKTRQEIISRIDRMIKEAEGENKVENVHIDDEISAVKSNLDLLSTIQQNIESEENMTYEEIMNNRETVIGISEHNTKNLSGVRSFEYPVFAAGPYCLKENLGSITTEEIKVSLPEPESLRSAKIKEEVPRIIENASQLKCSGIHFYIYGNVS